jgi:hypothetical protein
MFVAEIPVIAFCARLARRKARASSKSNAKMDKIATAQDACNLICEILAEMLPSTVEEIAQATGLAPVAAAAYLDSLVARYRVMFNQLTKRFSLPNAWPSTDMAA